MYYDEEYNSDTLLKENVDFYLKRAHNENMLYKPQTRRTAKEAIHRKGAVESHKGYWFYCRPSEDNQRFH